MGGANGGGAYVPPHLRKGANARTVKAALPPAGPTAESFMTKDLKFVKKGAEYFYPNPDTRPHIHVQVRSSGPADLGCVTMVALSSPGVKDAKEKYDAREHAGYTVYRNGGAVGMNFTQRKNLAGRLGICSQELNDMWKRLEAAKGF